MSDWVLIAGLTGVMAIASIDKFCEAYGFKNAVYAFKVGAPIAGTVGILFAVWSLT